MDSSARTEVWWFPGPEEELGVPVAVRHAWLVSPEVGRYRSGERVCAPSSVMHAPSWRVDAGVRIHRCKECLRVLRQGLR